MINQIRQSLFAKVLWGCMALYLLNVSVDTADKHPDHIPEDLSLNDQESMVELLIEQLFGFQDAIKEYDDHDSEDFFKKKSFRLDLMPPTLSLNQEKTCLLAKNQPILFDYDARLAIRFSEIDSPPPKY